MKTFIYLFILSLFLFSFTVSDGYKKYQTFDEYQLKGVFFDSKSIREPYVLVKEDEDSVWVRISNHLDKEPVKYVDKGRYWYYLMKWEDQAELYRARICLCDTDRVNVKEKFVFNDTIITCETSFYKTAKEKNHCSLTIDTKTKRLTLYIPENLEDYPDKFERIKYYINSYEKLNFYYYGFDDYSLPSRKIYYVFNKEIVNDSICYYKPSENKEYKLGCLYSVYQFNGVLGEFDPYEDNLLLYFQLESVICK